MFRDCLLFCVYLLSAVPATLLAKPKEAPTSPRAYIETSYLIAPRTVGPFSLARRAYTPDAKAAGAAFHYAMSGQPDLSIDVFVYPLGQRDQTQAIAEGMAAFRKDLASAVTQGSYSRLDELDQTTLVLPTNDAPAAAPANGTDAKVIAAIADAQRVVGEKLRLRTQLSSTGKPMRSNGYLFYKQLYYFKVRVSADEDAMAQDAFESLADQAALALVPAIQVTSIGGCAKASIRVDTDATPEEQAVALARQIKTHLGFNCHGTLKEAGIEDAARTADVVEIAYDAGDWKSQ
ncbi:hypothetical protein VDQ94_13550 [Xanthomonas campestris pv. campestris]|nr:hypothetical protein [Xanthomonas campestris pv. campestris]MEB1552927.1 hypothetical protein [Xanthomonas campestris pv. campestris]